MQARAVPVPSFVVLPRRQDSTPALEFPAKRREGSDLMSGLSDPLAEHPEQTRPDAYGARLSGRDDEVTDCVEGQPEGLGLANELEPVEI